MSTPRVAVVFPGQGSQTVGMGAGLPEQFPVARDIFERAARVLSYDLWELCQRGPEEKLRETEFSQPAIFVTNCALYAAAGAGIEPVVSAGHSFGELCSLTIAGSIEFEDALRVVAARGKAMQRAAALAEGSMSAILGLDPDRVRSVIEEAARKTGARVQLANFNARTQIVISGDRVAVDSAAELALAAGAKRAVPLNVSGAWHSALMEPATEEFGAAVRAATFRPPRFPVISNLDGQPYTSEDGIKKNLLGSLTQEVRWHTTAERILEFKPDLIAEFGATPVLAPLFKRMPGAAGAMTVSNPAGVENFTAALLASA